ncbi:MAG TPA: LysR family transcriptional regulator [Ramlibacter sp.]|nr:LysR family transcriptional regulator [Ramlibacter sp.]
MNLLASMRYLLALSEHRHFARAAEACHITQGGLSNAIRSLEEEFKVTIVKRERTYLGLTPEGEEVLATAQQMIREQDLLIERLAADAGQPRGPLRIGAVPTAMPVLALFASTLKAEYPKIVPVALSMSSPELEDGLNSLSLDLALGYTDRIGLAGNDLTALAQYTERYFLMRRSRSKVAGPLRIGEPVTWTDAAREPMALLVRGMHNRTIVDGAFASVGVAIQPAFETNSTLALALSVRAGTVCSVMPGGLVAAVRDHTGLEACPLVEPDVHTGIGFMARASIKASRVTQAALKFAATPKWREMVAANSGLLQETE